MPLQSGGLVIVIYPQFKCLIVSVLKFGTSVKLTEKPPVPDNVLYCYTELNYTVRLIDDETGGTSSPNLYRLKPSRIKLFLSFNLFLQL